ncbi:MAG: ATPase [Bacteroidetes bacterium 41-46]|nr:MAG: ATPase [Bacteroidetes bacterium 41-46]
MKQGGGGSGGGVAALGGLSFEVDRGEIFGVIGPDGAGKTTLFRILTTLLLPDSGEARVMGFDTVKDYREIRKIAGYMPGRFSLYQDLTVEENLKIFATLFNTTIEENYHLIRDIYEHLEPFKKRRAGALSGGMKQKLALSCALIHKPEVLFLDEPTTGIDPVSRKELWEMLRRLKKQGITIIVSTPYMDEASLCDRIALMQDGKFLRCDTPSAIIASFGKNLFSVKGDKMGAMLEGLRRVEGVSSCFAFGNSHHITAEKDNGTKSSLTVTSLKAHLESAGFTDVEVTEAEPTVEDCFMELLSK